MRRWLRRRRELRRLYPDGRMPSRFRALGDYNTEVVHGIVHTPAWDARMVELQREYDEWAKDVQEAYGLWHSPADRLVQRLLLGRHVS